MIAINNEHKDTDWQTAFLAMLPEIEGRLRQAFRHLDSEAVRIGSGGNRKVLICLCPTA